MFMKLLSIAVLSALGHSAAANPPQRALELVRSHPIRLRASPADEFVVRSSTSHGLQSTVRLERRYKGLPVFEGDVVMQIANDGSLKHTSLTQPSVINLDIRPTLSPAKAVFYAGVLFGSDFIGAPLTTLVIYARGPGAPKLAYKVSLANSLQDMSYFVDARSGKVLLSFSNNQDIATTGLAKTLYSGNVAITTNSVVGGYELRDPSRGNVLTINGHTGRTSGKIFKDTDNVWGDNTNNDFATVAADAQYGIELTWDFYKKIMGRNGIGNDGRGSSMRVHYGVTYSNAYWNDACFCMTFGDGGETVGPLVSIDIAGHEMSHGVMNREAKLTYAGESGGLNEANSDIMGTMVEFFAKNRNDPGDYLIGEKIIRANVQGSSNPEAIRYMYRPFKDGRSPNCYNANIGDLDVHFSSGVANHFFYLLAEGTSAKSFGGVPHRTTTCNGASLAGIGKLPAAKIWYVAVRDYMTAGTNYAGARTATLAAATALYGSSSVQYRSVGAAWSAVSVH